MDQSNCRLVPLNPTEEMGIAGSEAVFEMPNNTWLDHDEALACYKAMLTVAPEIEQGPITSVTDDDIAALSYKHIATHWPWLEEIGLVAPKEYLQTGQFQRIKALVTEVLEIARRGVM